MLNNDYFTVPEEEIKRIESTLTIVDGKVVYGTDTYAMLAPPVPPAMPDWSPVKHYSGYHRSAIQPKGASIAGHNLMAMLAPCSGAIWGTMGCDCFVF